MRVSMPMSMLVSFLIIGAALTLVVSGDSLPMRASGAPAAAPVIDATVSGCGAGWIHPHPGQQTLLLRNTGSDPAEVSLTDAATGAVYAEIDGIGPGTTRRMRVTLGAGTYAFRCLDSEGATPGTGPRTRITGPGPGGPAVVPVTLNDLYGPARSYQAYVTAGLKRLTARTDALRAAVDGGDLAGARAAWTAAHLAYERLGAAYGTFGDFDGEIDGLPAGLPGGVRDKDFTGFHRVEYGLWNGEPASSLAPAADRLAHDVHALSADFAAQRIDPGDLPLRAHEILENTLQFQLTGEADQGSGTALRTAAANLEGTRELIGVLRPLLRTRYPELGEVDAWMDRLDAELKGRSSLDRLSATERERLNGTVGRLLELLAPVASIGEPRRIR